MKSYKVIIKTDIINLGFMVTATNEDKAAIEGAEQAFESGVDIDEIVEIFVIPW